MLIWRDNWRTMPHSKHLYTTRRSVRTLAFCGLALLSACSKPAPPEEPVRAVKVLTVGAAALQVGAEYAAEVRPRIESRMSFRVAGKLLKRHVEAGQHVNAGQLLAEMDPQDFVLAVQAAQSQVAVASTNLKLADADYQRYKALRVQNFISEAELERRDTTLLSARAQLDQAQAQLAAQKNQLDYTRLRADVAGVVTGVDAEPGQVVGQVIGAAVPVVRIAPDGPRDAVFSVPEDQVALMKPGMGVTVKAAGRSLKGVLREVGSSADPATRTFLVKVTLPTADAPALGSTLSVLLADTASQQQGVLKLPTSALRQEGQATTVWVLEPASMTVKAHTIQIGALDGNEVVVASGLQPGMQVVATGVHVLSAGQKVTIYENKYK
jgi:membrane fusion protein, multidrug efflux system